MIWSAAAFAVSLAASVAAPQGESQSRLREQAIIERHDPKDYDAELKAALARSPRKEATLAPEELGFGIRERAGSAHPIRIMLLQEVTEVTRPTSSGGTVTTFRGRPRGVAVISSIEGRMNVEILLSESEIRARPRVVYEVLPSRLCPQVLAAFDIRGEPHVADNEEQKASARLDARFPELQQTARANAQQVELARTDEPGLADDRAIQHLRGVYGIRFGAVLPPLTEAETRDVAAILRSAASYREDGVSGCLFSPVIALQFPTRDSLEALICFQCRQIQFVRGKRNLDSPDLTGPAAQVF